MGCLLICFQVDWRRFWTKIRARHVMEFRIGGGRFNAFPVTRVMRSKSLIARVLKFRSSFMSVSNCNLCNPVRLELLVLESNQSDNMKYGGRRGETN